jgi:hypothetical protein
MGRQTEEIRKAKQLALDFAARAEAVIKEQNGEYFCGGTKKTGAMRRISMELTRALADLRKPYRN